jgi:hypothetical protein
MATSSMRVMVPPVATALVTSTTAVVVNLATEWKTNGWVAGRGRADDNQRLCIAVAGSTTGPRRLFIRC